MLLKEGFEALKGIEDAEDSSALLYYLINKLHLYADGNGRTSRLLYGITNPGIPLDSEQDFEYLVNHAVTDHGVRSLSRHEFHDAFLMEPEDIIDYVHREMLKEIDPEFSRTHRGIIVSGDLPMKLHYNLDFFTSENDRNKIMLTLTENHDGNLPFSGLALWELIKQNAHLAAFADVVDESVNAPISAEDENKTAVYIRADIIEELEHDDAAKLVDIQRQLKQVFIRTLIDIFVHPERHTVVRDAQVIMMKDIFQHTDMYAAQE